ncbi:glycosyltransferase [Arenimonas alkanexedens]
MSTLTVPRQSSLSGAGVAEETAPVATILLVAYRMQDTLVEALDSALAQTVPCEIIVSDDSSGDASLQRIADRVRDYRGPHRLQVRSTRQNLGLCAHLTELAPLARTGILVFLAGDDVAYPHRVERLVAHLQRHPQAMIVGSTVNDINSRGEIIKPRNRGQKPVLTQRDLRRAGHLLTVLGASMAVRREVFTAMPPLQGRVEDNALQLRAVLLGECHCLPEPLLGYRRHDDNLGSWVFDRSGADVDTWTRRQQRVAQMYREIADDQDRCIDARPDLPLTRREQGRGLARMYRLEADMREALLESDRRRWLGPLWAGLCFPGLRRKAFERSLKLLLPRRWFGRRG